uniref:Secreted protein n=1 Tax=Rhipicephalus appendiculatus TaxID=34631 RepID=A0A131YBP0_RHIAP
MHGFVDAAAFALLAVPSLLPQVAVHSAPQSFEHSLHCAVGVAWSPVVRLVSVPALPHFCTIHCVLQPLVPTMPCRGPTTDVLRFPAPTMLQPAYKIYDLH